MIECGRQRLRVPGFAMEVCGRTLRQAWQGGCAQFLADPSYLARPLFGVRESSQLNSHERLRGAADHTLGDHPCAHKSFMRSHESRFVAEAVSDGRIATCYGLLRFANRRRL